MSKPRRPASRFRRSVKGPATDAPVETQRLRFSAALPGLGGEPLLRMSLEMHGEPDAAGGERLRLRAHLQANFASGLRPALGQAFRRAGERALATLPNPAAAPAARAGGALMQALAPLTERASGWLGHWVEGRVQSLAPRLSAATAPFLSHDVQTWFELHASTSPLAQGARALLPEVARLKALGISPRTDADAPPMEQWAGRIGNEVAQIATLRLDDKHLPAELRAALGGKPFQLAAALVNVATRKP